MRTGAQFHTSDNLAAMSRPEVNAVISMVAGPKGMTAAQVAYWEDAFARSAQTAESKKDLERNLFENTCRNSADSRKCVAAQ